MAVLLLYYFCVLVLFYSFYSIVTISTSYEFVFCMDLWKMMNKLELKCCEM